MDDTEPVTIDFKIQETTMTTEHFPEAMPYPMAALPALLDQEERDDSECPHCPDRHFTGDPCPAPAPEQDGPEYDADGCTL